MQIELNDDTNYILGMPNFQCAQFREVVEHYTGCAIPPKAEREQAAVIAWFLNLYLEHGADWREKAGMLIQEFLTTKGEKAAT